MTLAYRSSGTGPNTLVLVHGFPFTSEMWQAQVDALGDEHWRVIAVDLPGFGDSPGAMASVDEAADAIATTLDEIGAPRVVLAGMSMGGYVALAFYRRHAARLRGLMLIDTKADADTDEAKRGRAERAAQVRAGGRDAVADAMLPVLLGETTKRERPDIVERARAMSRGVTPEGMASALLAMAARPDSGDDLPRVTVPSLVLVGEEDALTPPGLSKAMAEAMPSARLVTIPRAGHMAPLEQPEAVTAAMREWLARV